MDGEGKLNSRGVDAGGGAAAVRGLVLSLRGAGASEAAALDLLPAFPFTEAAEVVERVLLVLPCFLWLPLPPPPPLLLDAAFEGVAGAPPPEAEAVDAVLELFLCEELMAG